MRLLDVHVHMGSPHPSPRLLGFCTGDAYTKKEEELEELMSSLEKMLTKFISKHVRWAESCVSVVRMAACQACSPSASKLSRAACTAMAAMGSLADHVG